MLLLNAVRMAQILLLPRLSSAGCVVDATAGNGNDTLFLARNTPPGARVWAFDIQEAAIAKTRRLCSEHGLLEKIHLVCANHAQATDYLPVVIDAAMMNLGYLPGGSHAITTQPDSTGAAIRQLAGLLSLGGVLTIVAYPGHNPGRLEHESVRQTLAALPQKEYTVACWQMINQRSDPPILYIAEKIRE